MSLDYRLSIFKSLIRKRFSLDRPGHRSDEWFRSTEHYDNHQEERLEAMARIRHRIGPDTELSEGILMQELVVAGQSVPYNRPVCGVVSINEAREIAASRKNNEPCTYRVWARGVEGELIPV